MILMYVKTYCIIKLEVIEVEYNINITNLRKDLYKVTESVLETGVIVNVSSKKGDVIMMSKDEYNSLIETLYLTSNQDIKKSIIDGMSTSHDDCVKEEDVSW